MTLCGEMAGDVSVAPVLLGLGLSELSMNAVAIPQTKEVIRSARVSELRTLASQVLELGSVPEILAAIDQYQWRRTSDG